MRNHQRAQRSKNYNSPNRQRNNPNDGRAHNQQPPDQEQAYNGKYPFYNHNPANNPNKQHNFPNINIDNNSNQNADFNYNGNFGPAKINTGKNKPNKACAQSTQRNPPKDNNSRKRNAYNMKNTPQKQANLPLHNRNKKQKGASQTRFQQDGPSAYNQQQQRGLYIPADQQTSGGYGLPQEQDQALLHPAFTAKRNVPDITHKLQAAQNNPYSSREANSQAQGPKHFPAAQYSNNYAPPNYTQSNAPNKWNNDSRMGKKRPEYQNSKYTHNFDKIAHGNPNYIKFEDPEQSARAGTTASKTSDKSTINNLEKQLLANQDKHGMVFRNDDGFVSFSPIKTPGDLVPIKLTLPNVLPIWKPMPTLPISRPEVSSNGEFVPGPFSPRLGPIDLEPSKNPQNVLIQKSEEYAQHRRVKLLLSQAASSTPGTYVGKVSNNNNPLIPVLPRIENLR
ncbi:hypothetical protein BB561_002667 [Smittium simulii]|uniref:Uncharacterized protein n=1 Tax=Smittium simulii TaxID=133385 RepID=A0A2T9YPJ5_9FUNG|nr:hypothetical protein BB561_002667 [Smittium simulii]